MHIFFKTYLPEYKNLTRLGFPVLITQLGIIVVGFADTMMVGAYGLDELASAAFVNSLFMVVTVMQIGFATGLTPLIGALFGKGDRHKAGRVMRAGLQVNVAMSLGFSVLMGILYFYTDRMGQPEELQPLIKNYYIIILSSLLPMAVFNVCQQTANGVTDTATPMWIILGANTLNIAGNYVLIFGHFGFPELGLAGAGFSTLAARIASAISILVIFMTRKRYKIYFEGIRSAGRLGEERKKVWTTSYPVMIQSGVECLLWSLGAVVSGWFGKVQLAAYQVVNTISQLGFMIYLSIGTAMSIRVANFTGASSLVGIRRATSAGYHLCLLLASLASVVFILFARGMIHLFTPEEAVVASAVGLIPPLVLYQFCDATQLIYANALRGTSFVKPLLWISVVSYVLVGAPAMYLVAKTLDMGNIGVYYSFSAALGCASVLLFINYRRVIGILGRTFSKDEGLASSGVSEK